MVWVKVFAITMAIALAVTSAWIYHAGERFADVERRAYGEDRRPWWFVAAALTVVGLYALALFGFVTAQDRTWAAWVLMVVLPVGALGKGALVTWNPAGRRAVTQIAGNRAWRRISLARLPLAVVFLLLALLA